MKFGYEDALRDGKNKEAEDKLSDIIDNVDLDQIEVRQLALLYNDRGQARYRQVKFWEAKDDYDLAIKLYPDEAVIHYNRSTILYRMGDYFSALPGFQKAVELDGNNAEFKEGLNATQLEIDKQ